MPERVFYPYKFMDEGLAFTICGVKLDGHSVALDEHVSSENHAVELQGLVDWSVCEIDIEVRPDEVDLTEALAEDEGYSVMDGLVTCFCRSSRYRAGAPLTWKAADECWAGSLVLDRQNVSGYCETTAFLVRSEEHDGTVQVATHVGERIASSAAWRIYVDNKELLPGGDIDVRWKSFRSLHNLQSFQDRLYYLDLSDEYRPKVLLNEDHHDFKAALMNTRRMGPGARIRDSVIHSILQQVITSLTIEAVRSGPDDWEELDGWKLGLLRTIAPAMHPGMTADEAMRKAWETGRDDTILGEFLSRVGLAVQEHLNFPQSTTHLIKLIEERTDA